MAQKFKKQKGSPAGPAMGNIKIFGFNVSVGKAKAIFVQYKSEAIVVIAAVLCLLGTLIMTSQWIEKTNQFESKIFDIEEKRGPIRKLQKLHKDFSLFLSDVPQSVEDRKLISFLTNFSKNRDVKIGSFTSVENERGGFFLESKISFLAEAKTFQDAMLFLYDMEKSNFSLRVVSCQLTVKKQNMYSVNETDLNLSVNEVSIKATVSTVALLNDVMSEDKTAAFNIKDSY